MIVSIITVVFNCKDFIGDCLESVQDQTYHELEHIIVDGGSSDGTLAIIEGRISDRVLLFSEADSGYYDALNKGIRHSNGYIIGALNADDEFSNIYVVENIVACFKRNLCDAVYGNLNYVKRFNADRVVRRWRTQDYNIKNFRYGWMPAHPTLFVKKQLFAVHGYYSLAYGTCADYDLLIRFMYVNRVKTIFMNQLLVKMRTGGMSNGSLKKLLSALLNDYKILKSHHFRFSWLVVMLKKLRKIRQFASSC